MQAQQPGSVVVLAFRGDTASFLSRLVVAAVCITCGALITLLGALSAQLHIAQVWQVRSAIVGSALLVFGLVSAFVLLPRTLRDESSLQVRRDGLLVSLANAAPYLISWDDLANVGATDQGLCLTRTDATSVQISTRFGGHSHQEMARILEQQRMRANLSMLR
jgi:hypothetical protein